MKPKQTELERVAKQIEHVLMLEVGYLVPWRISMRLARWHLRQMC